MNQFSPNCGATGAVRAFLINRPSTVFGEVRVNTHQCNARLPVAALKRFFKILKHFRAMLERCFLNINKLKNATQPKCGADITEFAKKCDAAQNVGQTAQNLQRNVMQPKMRGRHHRFSKEKCDPAQNAGQTLQNFQRKCEAVENAGHSTKC